MTRSQVFCARRWLIVLSGMLSSTLVCAVELTPQFTTATTGDLLTWTITAAPEAWRTTDVAHTPQLKITDPAGHNMYRPAFAVADGVWVRHVPRTVGRHTWKLLDPQGATVADGQFTVDRGTNPQGPIGVSSRNHRYLGWANGTSFVPIGPNVCWIEGDPLAGYEAAFAKMAAVGCNHTRVWMCSWSLGIVNSPGKDLRFDRALQIDGVLAAGRRHGVRVTLVLDNHTDIISGKPALFEGSIEERQAAYFSDPPSVEWIRYLRYCLARWSADDALLAFELVNEADLAQPIRERSVPWVSAAADLLQRFDQDRRLHTISWCGGDWERVLANPAIDFIQLHHYVLDFLEESESIRAPTRDGVGMLLTPSARANNFGRPWLLAESGFQGTNADNPGNDLDTDGLLLRQQLWAGFLLGGCGGAMNWWWDVYLDPHKLWKVYPPFATIIARLDLTDPELAAIMPNESGPVRMMGVASARQALLWPQVRTDTWHRLLVENKPRIGLGIDQPIRLGGFVANRSYTLTPLDPRTAVAEIGQTLVADADGRLSFVLQAHTVEVLWHVALVPAVPLTPAVP